MLAVRGLRCEVKNSDESGSGPHDNVSKLEVEECLNLADSFRRSRGALAATAGDAELAPENGPVGLLYLHIDWFVRICRILLYQLMRGDVGV